MSGTTYDAIVIGARCAGSPIATLLARRGHRVLLVDRDAFPSDTISTHFIHPPGVAALKRWGILERLEATACPPVRRYSFDFGPFTIEGSPRPVDGVDIGYGPRRTILDKLLVDMAAQAGAEVREEYTVDELVLEDGVVTGIRGHGSGGRPAVERARVVIGADGHHSLVARTVQPEQYNERPPLEVGYYTYWSDFPAESFEVMIREGRGGGAIPTHDGLTLLVLGWPYGEFAANKRDIEGNYLRTLELSPVWSQRLRDGARREAPFRAQPVPNHFRRPFGPGWALVGDAGYLKDPITALGITDAFLDAERCAQALHDALTGARPYDEAMGAYQRERDEHAMAMFEMTCEFATMQPPPEEQAQLLGAVAGNRQAMDAFVSMMAATLPPPEFFAPENVGRIMQEAALTAG